MKLLWISPINIHFLFISKRQKLLKRKKTCSDKFCQSKAMTWMCEWHLWWQPCRVGSGLLPSPSTAAKSSRSTCTYAHRCRGQSLPASHSRPSSPSPHPALLLAAMSRPSVGGQELGCSLQYCYRSLCSLLHSPALCRLDCTQRPVTGVGVVEVSRQGEADWLLGLYPHLRLGL